MDCCRLASGFAVARGVVGRIGRGVDVGGADSDGGLGDWVSLAQSLDDRRPLSFGTF